MPFLITLLLLLVPTSAAWAQGAEATPPVVFVLDLSASMQAMDVAEQYDVAKLPPTRLERAKKGLQAFLEGSQDQVPVAAAHRHDERKPEFLPVCRVVGLETLKLFGRALVETRTGLLGG